MCEKLIADKIVILLIFVFPQHMIVDMNGYKKQPNSFLIEEKGLACMMYKRYEDMYKVGKISIVSFFSFLYRSALRGR